MTDATNNPAVNAFSAGKMGEFNKGIVEEFRANGGKVGAPFKDATLLLLTTTGAKSGLPRLNPLAYFVIDGKMVIIGSKAGFDTNPDWVHNLRANPTAHVEVGTGDGGIEDYDVVAREMPLEERDIMFGKVVALAPGFGEYQSKTGRVIPVFELRRA